MKLKVRCQIFLLRISQSEIRNSAAESEGGQKFLPPNPSFLPARAFSLGSATRSAAISRSFVQKRFERRSVIATNSDILKIQRRLVARKTNTPEHQGCCARARDSGHDFHLGFKAVRAVLQRLPLHASGLQIRVDDPFTANMGVAAVNDRARAFAAHVASAGHRFGTKKLHTISEGQYSRRWSVCQRQVLECQLKIKSRLFKVKK